MSPVWFRLVCVAWCAVVAGGCAFPGSVKPTIKVGLSAPFEGRYRDLGYEVLHAVRLAVRQRNEAGGVAEQYLVELVALNDFAEADAAVTQAHKMGVDHGVLGVVGGLTPEAARAAAEVYEQLGLAFLYPDVDLTQLASGRSSAAFEADYRTLSGGASPGPAAVWAYAEAVRLLDAMEAAVRIEGRPSRGGVRQALVGAR